MIKKLTVSGAIAAGVAGIMFAAAPAYAEPALTNGETQSIAERAINLDAVGEEAASLGAAGDEAATLKAVDDLAAASRPMGKKHRKPAKKVVKSIKSHKSTKVDNETEGHETEIAQKFSCQNTSVKVNVNVSKSKNTKVKVSVPSKDKCIIKSKTSSVNKGNVKTKLKASTH